MIFNNDHVTDLVIEWKCTKDEDTLNEILLESKGLVESIVSTFDRIYRDDLIQESYLRIQYALEFYNPDVAKLYNYLATVIRNRCLTYVTKQEKEPIVIDNLQILGGFDYDYIDEDEILSELIIRNRNRFPSLNVDTIDDISIFIYNSLKDDGMTRKSLAYIISKFKLSRNIARVVYQSTVVYLRYRYAPYHIQDNIDHEFTLMVDIKELIGQNVYDEIMSKFFGMNIKVP